MAGSERSDYWWDRGLRVLHLHMWQIIVPTKACSSKYRYEIKWIICFSITLILVFSCSLNIFYHTISRVTALHDITDLKKFLQCRDTICLAVNIWESCGRNDQDSCGNTPNNHLSQRHKLSQRKVKERNKKTMSLSRENFRYSNKHPSSTLTDI